MARATTPPAPGSRSSPTAARCSSSPPESRARRARVNRRAVAPITRGRAPIVKWPLSNRLRRRRDDFEGILELFDDHVHIGVLTADHRYVPRFSGPTLERF